MTSGSGCFEAGFEVVLDGADGHDVELLDEHVQHGRGGKRGERRAEADVLDAEVEQRQQDANGFLFVPRKDQRERQIVDAAVEGLCERAGHFDGGVGVVALSHV